MSQIENYMKEFHFHTELMSKFNSWNSLNGILITLLLYLLHGSRHHAVEGSVGCRRKGVDSWRVKERVVIIVNQRVISLSILHLVLPNERSTFDEIHITTNLVLKMSR